MRAPDLPRQRLHVRVHEQGRAATIEENRDALARVVPTRRVRRVDAFEAVERVQRGGVHLEHLAFDAPWRAVVLRHGGERAAAVQAPAEAGACGAEQARAPSGDCRREDALVIGAPRQEGAVDEDSVDRRCHGNPFGAASGPVVCTTATS